MRKKLVLIRNILIGSLISIFLIGIINFIPTWNLQTSQMHKLEGEWINVYYETEKEAAEDVFEYADSQVVRIATKLGITKKQNVNVYIYDHQNTMQMKKYGYIAPFLGLDWYIGDNIGINVILTTPANPGKLHSYENIKYAVIHEIVHAYVSVLNSHVDLWLTEGVALYLSNGKPFSREYLTYMKIPSYIETCTKDPITFANSGGYTFAHTYIDYIEKNYGWNSVIELVKKGDYESIFKKKHKAIYSEWIDYINND